MTSGCRLESTLEGRLADGRQVEKASAKRAFEWKKTATRRTGPARQLRFRSSHRPLNNPGQPIEPDQAFHRRLSCPPKVPMDDDRLAHEPRLANLAIFAPANGVGRTSSELPCRLCTPNDGGRLPNLSAERHVGLAFARHACLALGGTNHAARSILRGRSRIGHRPNLRRQVEE